MSKRGTRLSVFEGPYDVFQNFAAWTRTVSESQGAPQEF